MNLKTLRIQQFLFDLVTPQIPDFLDAQRLSVELLRDVIISKLTSKADGKYYFESLNSPDVQTYLTEENQDGLKINPNHLYDFAQTIEVVAFQPQPAFDFLTHVLGPWLCAERSDPQTDFFLVDVQFLHDLRQMQRI